MSQELSRDQQKLAHAFGGLRYLADPDLSLPEYGGGTLRLSLSTGEVRWFEYTTRGIRGFDDLGRNSRTLVAVTRQELQAHARSLPADLIDALREHQRRSTEHAQTFRAYPNRHVNPEGWEEVNRHHHEVRMPEYRAIAAEAKALRDRAYPLAVSTEPVDLLDLLALG